MHSDHCTLNNWHWIHHITSSHHLPALQTELHCRGVSRLRALARLPVTAGHAALHRVYCTGLHCIFCSALGCTAYIVLHSVLKCITVYCTASLSYCTVIVSNCWAHYLCLKDLSTLVSLAQNIKQGLFYRLQFHMCYLMFLRINLQLSAEAVR